MHRLAPLMTFGQVHFDSFNTFMAVVWSQEGLANWVYSRFYRLVFPFNWLLISRHFRRTLVLKNNYSVRITDYILVSISIKISRFNHIFCIKNCMADKYLRILKTIHLNPLCSGRFIGGLAYFCASGWQESFAALASFFFCKSCRKLYKRRKA